MTSALPRSILVLSGRYHIMSNASKVNNCIMLTYEACSETIETITILSNRLNSILNKVHIH